MNVSHKPYAAMTAREFDRNIAEAKRIAKHQPLIITKRGLPSHVLMLVEDYEQLKPGEPDEEPSE